MYVSILPLLLPIPSPRLTMETAIINWNKEFYRIQASSSEKNKFRKYELLGSLANDFVYAAEVLFSSLSLPNPPVIREDNNIGEIPTHLAKDNRTHFSRWHCRRYAHSSHSSDLIRIQERSTSARIYSTSSQWTLTYQESR